MRGKRDHLVRSHQKQDVSYPDAKVAAEMGCQGFPDAMVGCPPESLPRCATASVGAFLRLSVAIKTLGVMMYNFVWTSYYDDFIVVCHDTDCESL